MPQRNNIDVSKNQVLSEIVKLLNDMSSEAEDVVIEELINQMVIDGGQIVVNKTFVDKLDKMTDNILKKLQKSPRFAGAVSKFVKRMPEIEAEIKKFQITENGIKVPNYEVAKKSIIDEVINQMLDNGLNVNFAQPLRDLIYRNATTGGLSLSQAKKLIKEYIGAGKDKSGKLKSYLEQTAMQSVDMYSGAINKKLMETFEYNGMLITGTIIDNSSPQCIYCIKDLGGTIKRSDWPKVKDKATKKFQIIEGTTFDNLPINLLHWGCRHSFYPIILS